MSDSAFDLFQRQFREIDSNLTSLSDAIRREVPADQVQVRLYQLALAWDQANLHYMRAGNKIFDQNNPQIKQLTGDLEDAQEKLEEALQELQQVAKTLDKITEAVGIATSLFGLGVPAIASAAVRARLLGVNFTELSPSPAVLTPLANAKQLAGRLVGRRIWQTPNMHGLVEGGVTPGVASLMPIPGSQGQVVSSNTVQGVVQRYLSGKLAADPGIRYGDGSYYLPTVAEVQFILQESQLERRTWTAERFDCDDFGYVLKGEMSAHAYDTGDISFGLCVGLMWGNFDWITGYHAINWFVASDGVLRLIEPQTDDIYEASHCRGDITLLLV